MLRTYTELMKLQTFEERFRYLKLQGQVGKETFGFDRFINQQFYKSKEWLAFRDKIIIRDCGCDLGCKDREIIQERIIIHHMNPIELRDILDATEFLMNPEYVISTVHRTHLAIHYGSEQLLNSLPIERFKNDTCPWKL